MKLKVLSSSSSGNCYILQSSTGSLLIECGLPWRQILKGLDFNLSDVKACLISHEHKDHSKATLDVMKAGIDCYLSNGTAKGIGVNHHRLNIVKSEEIFKTGDFTIIPFQVEHDANEPLGYLIRYDITGEKLLFLTDTYYSKYTFKDINYFLVECNYIKETLDQNIENGYMNERMKSRLLQSHMSLENCKKFLKASDLSSCGEIVLIHLSDSNSDADRMLREVYVETGVMPKIAYAGMEVQLEQYPY